MIVSDSFKDTLPKSVHCHSSNIMHYLMMPTAPSYSTFSFVSRYRQCLSFYESKDIPGHLILKDNIKVAVNLHESILAKLSLGYLI